MTCRYLGDAIVCGPPPGIRHRVIRKCLTCNVDREQVQSWDGAWYGTTQHCLTCLDIWADGCRYPRPLKRYWKRERAAEIQRLWDSCISSEDWEAYTAADVRVACAVTEAEQEAASEQLREIAMRIRGEAA